MSDILFVCVHNAGRSQMAKVFFNRAADEAGHAIESRIRSAPSLRSARIRDEVERRVVDLVESLQPADRLHPHPSLPP